MFSAHEILRIAVDIEREGRDFYSSLADAAAKEEVSAVFRYLAGQEQDHAETFEDLLRRFREEEKDLINWDEASGYLKSFSRHKVFPNAESVLGTLSAAPVKEVIDFAVDIEKETVIFYYEILEILNDKDARDSIRKIIEEEKKHIVLLRKLLD